MSVSSVTSASHWFMADDKIKQSMKSLIIFLILKAVCRMGVSCISITFIVSLYIRALMPLETFSGGMIPDATYLAPFADSSNIVMLLMEI